MCAVYCACVLFCVFRSWYVLCALCVCCCCGSGVWFVHQRDDGGSAGLVAMAAEDATQEEGKLLNSSAEWVSASLLDGMPVGYYFAASWFVRCRLAGGSS